MEFPTIHLGSSYSEYDSYYEPYWKPVMEALGFDHKPHDTRHTCISMLAEAHVDQTMIKKIVGHKGAMSLTERVYTHPDIKALVDAKVLYECNRFDMKSRKSLSGEKKYYIADMSFYYSMNTDNRINYGPVLENIVYFYARSLNNHVSVGRIGKLECDFLIRNQNMDYSYVQVAYTILLSKETEDREYRPLEMIRDNYPKYVMTTDYLLQRRNGILHVNLMDFMKNQKQF